MVNAGTPHFKGEQLAVTAGAVCTPSGVTAAEPLTKRKTNKYEMHDYQSMLEGNVWQSYLE